MSTQTYVITATGGAVLIVAGSEIAQGRTPKARVLIGGTVAAFILSAAAGPFPDLARTLATVAILAAVLGAGYHLIKPLTQLVGTTER